MSAARKRDVRLLLSELAERCGPGASMQLYSSAMTLELEGLEESVVHILGPKSEYPATEVRIDVGRARLVAFTDACTQSLHRWIKADRELFERHTQDPTPVPEENMVWAACRRCGSTITRQLKEDASAVA